MGLHISDIIAFYNIGRYCAARHVDFKDEDLAVWANNYVIDENLSVKRNRELVEEHNQKAKELKAFKRQKQHELDDQLTEDVVTYIKEYFDLTDAQARAVERFAYAEHHSCMYDYFSYIDTLAGFAKNLIDKG